mmetsp:Transcript_388/g.1266  ORF Transcript_388/g.1266 Transcript_388/m.1266 type:complete len:400 (+) Transcript_388:363-1562(+)
MPLLATHAHAPGGTSHFRNVLCGYFCSKSAIGPAASSRSNPSITHATCESASASDTSWCTTSMGMPRYFWNMLTRNMRTVVRRPTCFSKPVIGDKDNLNTASAESIKGPAVSLRRMPDVETKLQVRYRAALAGPDLRNHGGCSWHTGAALAAFLWSTLVKNLVNAGNFVTSFSLWVAPRDAMPKSCTTAPDFQTAYGKASWSRCTPYLNSRHQMWPRRSDRGLSFMYRTITFPKYVALQTGLQGMPEQPSGDSTPLKPSDSYLATCALIASTEYPLLPWIHSNSSSHDLPSLYMPMSNAGVIRANRGLKLSLIIVFASMCIVISQVLNSGSKLGRNLTTRDRSLGPTAGGSMLSSVGRRCISQPLWMRPSTAYDRGSRNKMMRMPPFFLRACVMSTMSS